jgi:hypothetical protein
MVHRDVWKDIFMLSHCTEGLVASKILLVSYSVGFSIRELVTASSEPVSERTSENASNTRSTLL